MGEAKRRQAKGEPNPDRQKRVGRQRLAWGAGLVLVVGAVALTLYLATPGQGPLVALPEAPAEAGPFPAELDVFGVQIGDPDAPVVVREFADYQCPACAQFARVHERLKTDYIDTGKVRLVFFEMPLSHHANAMPAAQAARCAGDQDAYWDMKAQLFSEQSRWSSVSDPLSLFSGYAEGLGLHEGRFQRCLEREQRREQVEASVAVARQLRVASTPTVLVDNILLNRPGWEQLSGVIERELQR
ncbi:MAG: DsbA family protein [Pseudomonas sp.]